VISANKKVAAWMADGAATTRLKGNSLTLEEALRRVEQQLRAG
jgi:hypothetical protein